MIYGFENIVYAGVTFTEEEFKEQFPNVTLKSHTVLSYEKVPTGEYFDEEKGHYVKTFDNYKKRGAIMCSLGTLEAYND